MNPNLLPLIALTRADELRRRAKDPHRLPVWRRHQ